MRTIVFAALVLAFSSGIAMADVLEVAPSEVIVLPSDGSGVTKVAIQFDLTGMREGEGRVIDQALLEWTPAGLSEGRRWEFAAYRASEAWSEESIATTGELATAELPTAEWEFDRSEDAVDGGGLIRFDLKGLVADWDAGRTPTHGLVLAMDNLDARIVAQRLSEMRLTVYYGFHR